MITLTRMDGKDVSINENWLVVIEENPDTTLIFSNGLKLIVKESRRALVQKIKAWRLGDSKAGKAVRRPARP